MGTLSILLAEDDPQIAAHMLNLLRQEGWRVTIVETIAALNEKLSNHAENFSLLILDRLMGDDDTRNRLPAIRETFPHTPLLVVSTINTPTERAEMLNLGVDDYLGKPFMGSELVARVRALLRRSEHLNIGHIKVGNTLLDTNRFVLQVHGGPEEVLPQKEFLLFKNLSRDAGRVWSKDALLATVWGVHPECESNVVEATVNNLRRRLETLTSNVRIKNLRNVGYFIET